MTIDRMQIALGIHGILSGALVLVNIREWNISPSFNPLLIILDLLWVGLLVVLIRHALHTPWKDQPVARFRQEPAVTLVAFEALVVGYLLAFFNDRSALSLATFWIQFALLGGGILTLLAWGIARIRFHVGTWLLAYGVTVAGFACQVAILSSRLP